MRLFVAVNPGPQLCRELALRVDPVRLAAGSGGALRWTRPDSWHLTLQFLGEWPEERALALEQALRQLPPAGAITLRPGSLGAFPNLLRPRVLFLQMASDGKAERLAEAVRTAVRQVWPEGPQDNRDFLAHLTLARVKGHLDAAEKSAIAALDLAGLPATEATGFRLVASALKASGVEHRNLAVLPLAGG